jgi:cell wall integrity and stress response component
MADASPAPFPSPKAEMADLDKRQNPTGIQMSTPTVSVTGLRELTSLGCFATAAPMVDHGPHDFQSKGNCQPICWLLEQPIMGIVNGTNCWCGSLIPPEETKEDDALCNTPCSGIDTEFCGGNNMWTVYNSGFSRNKIANLPFASLSSSVAAKPSTTQPVVVVTEAPSVSASSSSSSSGGSSKVGVAVGAVIGVVAIIGMIGGVIFWLRWKKRRDAEEEYKRQAAVNAFVNGGKGHNSTPSLNDSRLDPEILAAGRRDSTGTIADNQDYSRKILRVRDY